MRIAVLDKLDNVIGFLDNDVKDALHYYEDTLDTYLKGTASKLSFSVYTDHPVCEGLVPGHKVAFVHNNRHYYMNIVRAVKSDYVLTVEAYAGSLELINEKVGSYKGTSMTFEQYLNAFTTDKVLTVGINEVYDKKISFEWTGEATLLERLFSLATEFDAEIEIIPELSNNYSLKRTVLNVYKEHSTKTQGIGKDRKDVILRYGKDIEGVTRETSIVDLYTAIKPVGKDGLTLNGWTYREVLDEEGNLEYMLDGTGIIYAVKARDNFPSNLQTNNRYIVYPYEYQTDSREVLYGNALNELKKKCVPEVTYEIPGYIDGSLGDTFTIVDDQFKPELYLSARIVEQSISFTDPSRNKTTFSNVEVLKSEVSMSLIEQSKELKTLKDEVSKKVAAYYQTVEPSGDVNINDIWFDIGNGNKMYAYTEDGWVEKVFGSQAVNEIAGAVAGLDSAIFAGEIKEYGAGSNLNIKTGEMFEFSGSVELNLKFKDVTSPINLSYEIMEDEGGMRASGIEYIGTYGPASGSTVPPQIAGDINDLQGTLSLQNMAGYSQIRLILTAHSITGAAVLKFNDAVNVDKVDGLRHNNMDAAVLFGTKESDIQLLSTDDEPQKESVLDIHADQVKLKAQHIMDVQCEEFVLNGLHYVTFKSLTRTWAKGTTDLYNDAVTALLNKLVGKTVYACTGSLQRDNYTVYGTSTPMMGIDGNYNAGYGHSIWIDLNANPKRIKVTVSGTWTNYHANLLVVYGD